MAQDDNKSVEAHLAMKERMKGGPRKTITSLNVMVKATERGMWPTPCLPGNGGSHGKKKLAKMLWPSPTARDCSPEGISAGLRRKSPKLTTLVSVSTMFPTPQSRDFRTGESSRWMDEARSRNLNDFVAMVPTPCAQDAKNSTLPVSQRDRESIPGFLLSNGENPGGQLNPDWVEWLMGWPIGWTGLGPLNLTAFREWQKAFSIGSVGSKELETDRFRHAL